MSGPGTKNYQLLGPVLFFIKSLIVNSFLGVIVPQIVLTYGVIYWLLPKFFFRRKNIFIVCAVTVSTLLAFYMLALACKFAPDIYNNITGVDKHFYSFFHPAHLHAVIIDQLTSLPIILGLALFIKFFKVWWLKEKETAFLANEKIKSELKLLKAQVHPHFLFNTLNNIYYFSLSDSFHASVMIGKLSGMLSYILNECNLSVVPLERETQMIRDYMALEKIRYGEQMQMTVDIQDGLEGKMIAPFLLLPFVENSFKHGASRMIDKPWIRLNLSVENNRMQFSLLNSRPGNETFPEQFTQVNGHGNVGLKNVIKRLELLYPSRHQLKIINDDESYAVYLTLYLNSSSDQSNIVNELNPGIRHAMA